MNDVLYIIHELQRVAELESIMICHIDSNWNILNGYLPFIADKLFILCRKMKKMSIYMQMLIIIFLVLLRLMTQQGWLLMICDYIMTLNIFR